MATFREFQKDCARTANRTGEANLDLMQSALGICGEAGECAEIVKKHVFQGHELNTEHIMEELGDLMFYITEMLNLTNYTMEEVIEYNIVKRRNRYPNGFEVKRSVLRGDEEIDI